MIEALGGWRRTHSCGVLRAPDAGQAVTLMGWAYRRRDHGGLIFVDLRDREGLTQLVFNPALDVAAHEAAGHIRAEFVLAVSGTVQRRPPGTVNPALPTGEVEIAVQTLRILNEAKPLPFPLDESQETVEPLRLRYRYLDLRRPAMLGRLVLRDQVCQAVRDFLHREGFVEVETPALTRSTPEGARDFLVPSRLARGSFYALPQSPQLFKQILMVAGLERYFQIVRCFRDEDLRADRQPEFTQIDIETSFLDRDEFLPIMEGLIVEIFQRVKGITVPQPFPRLAWDDAIARYGSDKPDLRFGLELADCSDLFEAGGFQVFARAVAQGGAVKALTVPGGSLSRKDLDDLVEQAKGFGAHGLVWVRVGDGTLQSPVARHLEPVRAALGERCGARAGDVILLVADAMPLAALVLGRLRVSLAERLGLARADTYRLLWVVDFPLVEWNEEEKRWDAMHHPFTAPRDEDAAAGLADPARARAKAYDMVLNGQEIGGGSIRIHSRALQQRVFELLGVGEAEARAKFGFLLEALEYGAPPMGGIAFGLDRIVAILAGVDSIREVIAFPKTQRGSCPLTDAPAAVSPAQLAELGLVVAPEPRTDAAAHA
ncbi:MAG TPA: aspartate--tRNA ligase [Methylomirabilota bacterium]|jgi:aspartyl-tRNA synthetase|nr:aspartate--tRNA ligase [Methylomirabilota bacterium]